MQELLLLQELQLSEALSTALQKELLTAVPKPQQERGSAVGEKASIGNSIDSKFAQGSVALPNAVHWLGTHLPKELTSMLTVRNSFTMVNRPIVTLTAIGVFASETLSQPLLQPQQQELQFAAGYFSSAAKATALPSATTKGPP